MWAYDSHDLFVHVIEFMSVHEIWEIKSFWTLMWQKIFLKIYVSRIFLKKCIFMPWKVWIKNGAWKVGAPISVECLMLAGNTINRLNQVPNDNGPLFLIG